MEDTMTVAGERDAETGYESSGSLVLNGDSWKNRDNTTYTSLLDKYGAADLFSSKNMELYQEINEEKSAQQQVLTEYIFSGKMQTKSEDENMIELIFSQEIQLSKVRDYSRTEDDYTICFVMAEMLFVLVFLYILIKINAGRKKRRESHAVEIDLES